MPSASRSTTICILLSSSVGMMSIDGPVWARQGAQQTQPATSPAAVLPSPDAADSLAMFRAPLLREGSHLVEAEATMQRNGRTGQWNLVIDSTQPGGMRHELTLLPCTRLAEMLRIADAAHGSIVTFRVSGEVLAYRNKNYLLPRHALVVEGGKAEVGDGVSSAPPPATAPSVDSAEDIIRGLEQAAGPVTRASSSVDRDAESPGDNEAAARDEPGTRQPIMREDSAVTNRRGTFRRDNEGGWMFIFDADASGLVDPPIRLLPCLLLERIEHYTQRIGNNAPGLLSGQVYVFKGENYLLPTVFRIPQERRNLTP